MIRFLKFFIPFTLIFGAIQYYIVTKIFSNVAFLYNTITIYGFNFIITTTIFSLLLITKKKSPLNTGFVFIGANLLKMMLVVLFLIPLIKSNTIPDKAFDMITVIIPYFLFLIFETFFTVQLLNQK